MSALPRPALAVIGGTGFYDFFDTATQDVEIDTPYGAPSAPIAVGEVAGRPVAVVARERQRHPLDPPTLPLHAHNLGEGEAQRSQGPHQVTVVSAVVAGAADGVDDR
ncbi:hypothetical protein [Nocardia farcinica]|uniref:hypothetical protein n=1 Tax=Nocardia farcinica TaxID=37329 RepID=UPI003CC7DDA5